MTSASTWASSSAGGPVRVRDGAARCDGRASDRSSTSPAVPSAAGLNPAVRSASISSTRLSALTSTVGAIRRSSQRRRVGVGEHLGEQHLVVGAQERGRRAAAQAPWRRATSSTR